MIISCMKCRLHGNCDWTKSGMWNFIDVEMQRRVCETNQFVKIN